MESTLNVKTVTAILAVTLAVLSIACQGALPSRAPDAAHTADGGSGGAAGRMDAGDVPGASDDGSQGGSQGGSDAAAAGERPEAGAADAERPDKGMVDGGSLVVPPATCVDVTKLPAWRQDMAIGQWKQLATADIGQVKPATAPGGSYSGRINAWNGFATDTVNSVVYLGGVGGHGDYAGNEVYTIDINAASPQWVIRQQPSPASAYIVDSPYYADGQPSPTHTYYTAWFIEQRAKFFRFAGSATWGSGNGGTRHIDSWDPTTSAWDPAGSNPDLGERPYYEMPTAKNFLTGDVYQLQSNGRLYRWNQQANTVTDLGEAAGAAKSSYDDFYKSPSVVDTMNNRVIFLSDVSNPGAARIYDISAKTWSSKVVGGADASAVTAGQSQGMAFFDVCAKRIVVKTGAAGAVYFLDPTMLSAVAFPTSGAAPPDAINGVHTLFQYVPKLGGYAYQPTHDSRLFFLATQ
jgi:hypothetical protein